jgi:transcription initiation factor TFIID subunit 1
MRTREDISAKDGRLVLFEYAEEHPLLMSCIGMASRIKNYSKKGANGDPVSCEHLKYGDQVYNTSPYFLGKLHAGQVLQVIYTIHMLYTVLCYQQCCHDVIPRDMTSYHVT